MINYIVAAVGNWNLGLFEERSSALNGNFHFASTPNELDGLLRAGVSPRYIFFLHWRWVVPKSVVKAYECVCFHMTDVPFGRGGSPLQNLIVRGYKDTVLTSLKMDEGIDSGPVYIKRPLNMGGSAAEIYRRSAELSWDMINEILTTQPAPQQQKGIVTEFKRRLPEQSEIPHGLNISQVYDYIRMLDADGYPKAFFENDSYRFVFENASIDGDQICANVSIKIRDK